VTWGVLILATVATGWVRKLVMVLSVYWTFVGVTAVKNVGSTIIHTNVLADLILLAGVVALLIYPLDLFGRRTGRFGLPHPRPESPGSESGLLPA
jgi:hypothetical protein